MRESDGAIGYLVVRKARRDDTHDGEEAERREIGNTRGAQCRSPTDWTWHDGTGEQAIDNAPVNGGGIELEVVGHAVRLAWRDR